MAKTTPFVYKGAYGFKLTFTLDPDATGRLADTTSMLLKIKPPTGVTLNRPMDQTNIIDVTTGKVSYDVVAADFALVGEYQLQIFDDTPGRFIPTEIKKLQSKDVL